MWNEQRDGDYVRRRVIQETTLAANQRKITSKALFFFKTLPSVLRLNCKEMKCRDVADYILGKI